MLCRYTGIPMEGSAPPRHIDWALWNRAVEIEQAEVESMMDFHEAWRDRLEGAGTHA